ncbi:MAG: BMP family ABC transporter substrate-binding protein [Clostridiales bacterium]|nr:BMP family ABC transporter substrate-binding protein [Clostridiales bacterium]
MDRRLWILVLLFASFPFLLPACGGQSPPALFRVALVVPGTLGDHGLWDGVYEGLKAAKETAPIDLDVYQSQSEIPSQWEEQLTSASRSGRYDLIITGGRDRGHLFLPIARQFPQQHYAYFGNPSALPNTAIFLFRTSEATRAAGVLAGLMAQSLDPKGKQSVAWFATRGVSSPESVAFEQGLRSVDPHRPLEFIPVPEDPKESYSIAYAAFQQGVLIGATDSSISSLGILRAAAAADAYAIGYGEDQRDYYPGHVLGSIILKAPEVARSMVLQAKAGTLPFGDTVELGLESSHVLLLLSPDLPPTVRRDLQEILHHPQGIALAP